MQRKISQLDGIRGFADSDSDVPQQPEISAPVREPVDGS